MKNASKIKIMFVCHGNICRSPMAELLMKKEVENRDTADKFYISSSATHTDEIGSGVYYATEYIYKRLGIDYSQKRATLLRPSDYAEYDYFIGMDEANRRNMKRIFNGDPDGKVFLFSDFTGKGEVSDPWYTRNFEKAYEDIRDGINAFLDFLSKDNG